MRNPVEKRGCHLGISEDRDPFAELQVGGDDDAGLFIEFGLVPVELWLILGDGVHSSDAGFIGIVNRPGFTCKSRNNTGPQKRSDFLIVAE